MVNGTGAFVFITIPTAKRQSHRISFVSGKAYEQASDGELQSWSDEFHENVICCNFEKI